MTEPLIPGGYIILSRKIIESEIWNKPPLYLKVWIYLLNKAQYSEYKSLKRGQLFTSIPEIQQNCFWYVGFRKVVPTKDQIFQVIEWLRTGCAHNAEGNAKATMIATMKATHGIVITIHNYGLYQDSKNYESNDDGNNEKTTKPPREQRQPDNINKNNKNNKNDKKNIYTPDQLEQIKEVVDYLNAATGKNFSYKSKATQGHIAGRFREGHDTEDFFYVIDRKTKQWKNDKKFSAFLRPSTLFSPTNFENYLNE